VNDDVSGDEDCHKADARMLTLEATQLSLIVGGEDKQAKRCHDRRTPKYHLDWMENPGRATNTAQ